MSMPAISNEGLESLLSAVGSLPPPDAPDLAFTQNDEIPAIHAATRKIRTETASLNNERPTGAQSIRSMSAMQLVRQIEEATKIENMESPCNIEYQQLHSKVLNNQYTGNKEALKHILNFFEECIDFCNTDKENSLTTWGTPESKELSRAYQNYLEEHAISRFASSGKSLCTVFRFVAEILWPQTHKRKKVKDIIKARRLGRKLYGLKLRNGTAAKTGAIERDGTAAKTGEIERDLTNNPPPIPTPKKKRATYDTPTYITPTNKRPKRYNGTFTPYHDILQNNEIYTVRIILPLMHPDAVRLLSMNINLAMRKCTISGSYWPSTLIGCKSAEVIHLGQPLLPIIYAPPQHNGQFALEIALPSDIKDDVTNINSIHDSWGLLIPIPRRKITQETDINMSSCFGTTKLSINEMPITPPKPFTMFDTKESSTPPAPIQDWKITEDPTSLIGMKVNIDGALWGANYKGQKFAGTIKHCEINNDDGFHYFTINFQDCRETMYLDELRNYEFITADQYDILKAQCTPAEHVFQGKNIHNEDE